MIDEQKGVTVWFTGLPCSGKTTVADRVAENLRYKGLKIERLDGDIVRRELTKDLGFSKEDRRTNIERVTYVAKLLTRNGVMVLSTFVSPYATVRAESRVKIGSYLEVFVDAPIEVCIRRDIKGMYKKALAGEIKDFTGVDDPYEEPGEPDLVLKTHQETIDESAAKVIAKLSELGFV